MRNWVDEEVYFVPLSALCEECEEDKRQCSLYRPRMTRDDWLPWDVCRGFVERKEETWEK